MRMNWRLFWQGVTDVLTLRHLLAPPTPQDIALDLQEDREALQEDMDTVADDFRRAAEIFKQRKRKA